MSNVVKGYDVQKTTTVNPNGQTITRQLITPDVAVSGNVRKLGPAGPGIPIRMSQEQQDAVNAMRAAQGPYGQLLNEQGDKTIMFGGRGAGAKKIAGQATSAKVVGGEKNVGGQIRLPSRSEARKRSTRFGPEDIQNFELNSIPGMVRQPDSWADLPPANPGEISFYTYDDSYGTTNTRHRNYGMSFSFRYLPYDYMTQQRYLEWLVSLSYKLRHEWPQFHSHNYDPSKDTIATTESFILVTLGRLEAANKFFKRSEMFYGASEFRNVLHPILAEYSFKAPQKAWYSPLINRYTDGAGDVEARAIDDVEAFGRQLLTLMRDQLKIEMTWMLNDADTQVMALVEDYVLSLLARLQYIHGYVVNTYASPIDAIVRSLLSIGSQGERRFLDKEFARYIELFQLDDEPEKQLHYLALLRLRQAKDNGLVLPKPLQINNTLNGINSWSPIQINPQNIPPNQFQTVYAPPNIVYTNAAAAAGGNSKKPKKITKRTKKH